MTRSSYRSIPWIILLRLFGLVFFLILVYIANHLAFFTENPLNFQIIQFLNNNIWLIIVMSIIFLFGEVFNALVFPFNLAAPLFNASASVLLVTFLFRIFTLIDILLNEHIFQIFNRIAFLVYPLVFVIVLIGGYITILARLSQSDEDGTGQGHNGNTKKKLSWEDVGDEFKQTIFDLLTLMRRSIHDKK